MSGKLTILYLDGATSKVYTVAAATEIAVLDGVLSFKDSGKLRVFSLVSLISYLID